MLGIGQIGSAIGRIGSPTPRKGVWPFCETTVDLDFSRTRYFFEGEYHQSPVNLLTVHRPSVGWAQFSDGRWVSFPQHSARITDRGCLIEDTRTNVALWCRDLTDATWVKSGVAAYKDQVGIDGEADSASRIVASVDGSTVIQSAALASSQRTQSAFMRRLLGTGPVEMTTDGVTWTMVPVTDVWAQVQIPAQTLANPQIGIRLLVAGDQIAVDFVQNENGSKATSPILTTTTAMERARDGVRLTDSAPFACLEGTMFVEWFERMGPVGINGVVASLRVDGNNFHRIQRTVRNRAEGLTTTASAAAASLVSVNNVVPDRRYRAAFAIKDGDFAFACSEALQGTILKSLTGAAPGGTPVVWLGSSNTGNPLNGYLTRFAWSPRRVSDGLLSCWSWLELDHLVAGDEFFAPGAMSAVGSNGETVTFGGVGYEVQCVEPAKHYSIQRLVDFTVPIFRFETRDGDRRPSDLPLARRAELNFKEGLPYGSKHWHSIAFWVDPGEVSDGNHSYITQLHDIRPWTGVSGVAPMISVGLQGFDLVVLTRGIATDPQITPPPEVEHYRRRISRSAMHWLLIAATPGLAGTGHLECWLDTVKMVDTAAVIGWPAFDTSPQWKVGDYTRDSPLPDLVKYIAIFGSGLVDLSAHAVSPPMVI